jgi:anaerobic magnesium-protoporphyrin IX monomethyl ester cyclase
MVCLEDGITSCGFRKIPAHVAQLNPDTEAYYVTTNRYRGIRNALFGGLGSGGELNDDEVDAICTGEGEFAFEELFDKLRDGRDHTDVKNFWFKDGDDVKRNHFLPLMTAEEMEQLPFPLYREKERIFRPGEGFDEIGLGDYVTNDGLSYTTLWSIGCPFHCSYCGNTKFIANDAKYKRIRHPSARYIVDQVKDARRRFPI